MPNEIISGRVKKRKTRRAGRNTQFRREQWSYSQKVKRVENRSPTLEEFENHLIQQGHELCVLIRPRTVMLPEPDQTGYYTEEPTVEVDPLEIPEEALPLQNLEDPLETQAIMRPMEAIRLAQENTVEGPNPVKPLKERDLNQEKEEHSRINRHKKKHRKDRKEKKGNKEEIRSMNKKQKREERKDKERRDEKIKEKTKEKKERKKDKGSRHKTAEEGKDSKERSKGKGNDRTEKGENKDKEEKENARSKKEKARDESKTRDTYKIPKIKKPDPVKQKIGYESVVNMETD